MTPPGARPTLAQADARARAFEPPRGRTGGKLGQVAYVGTALAFVGVWVSTWVGRQGISLPWPAEVVLTFLPFVAAGLATWAFLLWTALPDHRWAPAMLLATVVAPLAHWGPSWAAWPEEGAEPTVTVMTWNLRRLWGAHDGDDAPAACVIEAVEAAEPDLLVLQELTIADVRTLSSSLQLDCSHATYGAGDPRDAAGVAVCTRGDTWSLGAGGPAAFPGAEDWRYVDILVENEEHALRALGVHLRPHRVLHDPLGRIFDANRKGASTVAAQRAEAEALLARVANSAEPTVIAGDFNSAPDAPLHARMRATLTDAWRSGGLGLGATVDLLGWFPVRIDYVYADARLAVGPAEVPETTCSDHRPVKVDLHWRTKEPNAP